MYSISHESFSTVLNASGRELKSQDENVNIVNDAKHFAFSDWLIQSHC